MPNWVYNKVTVTAPNTDALNAFENHIATEPEIVKLQPVVDGKKGYVHEGFTFHSFITLDAEHAEEYWAANGSGPTGSYGDTEYNWYNWNTKHWDTKWDANNVYVYNRTHEIEVTFETAWSDATPIWQAMTDKFPELTFNIWWEEEQGFGQELTAWNGVVTIDKEWDIPDSHQDHVDQDKLDNCICTYYEDPDDWYSDCPREDLEQVWVIETITKRYVVAYSLEDAFKAAQADEGGYDLPSNTSIKDVLYAEEYREAPKEEETNE